MASDSRKVELLVRARNQTRPGLRDAEADVDRMAGRSVSAFRRISSEVINLRNLITGAAVVFAGKAVIEPAIDIETFETEFGQLLQDVEKGAQFVKDQIEFAASTPLELPTIATLARSLLAVNVPLEDTIGLVRRLGDLALGDAERLDRLGNAYTKLLAKGRATMEELNLFTEAGVPLLAQLAKNFGLVGEQGGAMLAKRIERGQVSVRDIQQAIMDLTDEGSKYGGMMEKIAEKTKGRLSTLRDNWRLARAEVGEQILPLLNTAIEDLLAEIQRLSEDGSLREFGEDTAGVVRDIYEALQDLAGFISRHKKSIATLGITAAVLPLLQSATQAIIALNAQLVAYNAQLVAAGTATTNLAKATAVLRAGIAAVGPAIALAGFTKLGLTLRELVGDVNDMRDAILKTGANVPDEGLLESLFGEWDEEIVFFEALPNRVRKVLQDLAKERNRGAKDTSNDPSIIGEAERAEVEAGERRAKEDERLRREALANIEALERAAAQEVADIRAELQDELAGLEDEREAQRAREMREHRDEWKDLASAAKRALQEIVSAEKKARDDIEKLRAGILDPNVARANRRAARDAAREREREERRIADLIERARERERKALGKNQEEKRARLTQRERDLLEMADAMDRARKLQGQREKQQKIVDARANVVDILNKQVQDDRDAERKKRDQRAIDERQAAIERARMDLGRAQEEKAKLGGLRGMTERSSLGEDDRRNLRDIAAASKETAKKIDQLAGRAI